MAAAVAVLDELWSPAQCVAHNARGDALREAINQLAQQHGAPLQACGTGSLTTLIWQREPVIGEVNDETVAHELLISSHAAGRQLPAIFWFFMVLRHGFLAGSPRLNYLTLPTPLSDGDLERFLSALSDFLSAHRGLLELLAEETA